MDALQQDFFYWQLVHHLVIQKGMRVIEVNPRYNEVWLEEEDDKLPKVIRVLRVDMNWSNRLKDDMQATLVKFNDLRRQLSFRKMVAENIYVSTYGPVDSWEHLFLEPLTVGQHKTVMHSYLIEADYDKKARELKRLHLFLMNTKPIEDMFIEEIEVEIRRLRTEVLTKAEERLHAEQSIFTYGKPVLTYFFLLAVAIMFGVLEWNGGSMRIATLIEYGAKYNPLIEAGEYWRLITAMFLHIGFIHFFMNSLALFYLGSAVEKIFGSLRFLFIYMIAGIFGSISSYAFNEQVAAGASGAIFGCFGALLFFGVNHRKLFFRTMGMSVIVILIINISLGFLVPMIDNSAHIGGLIGGFLASFVVQLPSQNVRMRQFLFFIIVVILGYGLFTFGMINDQKAGEPMIHLQFAQELLEEEEYEEAYSLLLSLEERNLDLPEYYFLLGFTEVHLRNLKDAEKNFIRTVELRPEFHEAHYNLALIYVQIDETEKAFQAVNQALIYSPEKEPYVQLKEKLKR
ncbi:rhomboid family intramembrane serine protease [Alkalihalobacillus sp. BA299]|uniref:rhomboid family protein n=1 Tax=Alkalihalobacillus sp. BA299 TaxID=2815938 RepID=UPI001ADAC68E|nr:rhomboid family intramembrane serine protease [Alkalihalobacillus sp. BA299]